MDTTMNDFETELKVIIQLAENNGATVARNKDGQVDDIFFTPYDLLRYTDYIVSTTMENYDEIKDTKAV